MGWSNHTPRRKNMQKMVDEERKFFLWRIRCMWFNILKTQQLTQLALRCKSLNASNQHTQCHQFWRQHVLWLFEENGSRMHQVMLMSGKNGRIFNQFHNQQLTMTCSNNLVPTMCCHCVVVPWSYMLFKFPTFWKKNVGTCTWVTPMCTNICKCNVPPLDTKQRVAIACAEAPTTPYTKCMKRKQRHDLCANSSRKHDEKQPQSFFHWGSFDHHVVQSLNNCILFLDYQLTL